MKKISVVFVDCDENYLMALEKKFSEEIGGYLNISIITDMYYYDEFFRTPREIDILVINEQIYDVKLKQHNIKCVYILSENPFNNDEDKLYNLIYKYTSVSDIFIQISNNEMLKPYVNNTSFQKQGVITVCSPGGGTGKTSIAIITALSLARVGKRVIYISRDYLQAFSYYFDNTEYISEEMKLNIEHASVIDTDTIRSSIRNNLIDFLLPFKDCLKGINNNKFIEIIEAVKKLNIYDYIVIDTDKVDSEGLMASIEYSDKVMVVTTQEILASEKLKKFSEQIKGADENKIIYICNKYMENKENALLNHIDSFYIKEYIYYDEAFIDSKVDIMLNNPEVYKIANLIL